MILVVAALVMLAMLGMAYLQVARLDRVAAAQITQNNIDVVANATVAYLADVLRNDVVGASGVALNTADHVEAIDYPYTKSSASFTVKLADGSTRTAKGGQDDDTWLAATEPTSSGSINWPHVTNLNGIFLRFPKTNQ
ncbi:MAG: hypothetical protein IT440_12550, partial [Phycisphaeraceae bacterium]|nr:hypothetical protein [Phycisphaeraceae bacterium]